MLITMLTSFRLCYLNVNMAGKRERERRGYDHLIVDEPACPIYWGNCTGYHGNTTHSPGIPH